MIIIRNMRRGERLPESLYVGFMAESLSPNMVWVAEADGRIVAALVTFEAHGYSFFVRLTATEDAPKSALLKLLRGAARDCVRRGILYYLTIVDGNSEPGQSFMKITAGRGGPVWDVPNTFYCAGKIEDYLKPQKKSRREVA